MQHISAQQMCKTPFQCIKTQKSGVYYTKLTQLLYRATNFHIKGCSTSLATLTSSKTAKYTSIQVTKPNLLVCIDSINIGNILLLSRSTSRPLVKGSERYIR